MKNTLLTNIIWWLVELISFYDSSTVRKLAERNVNCIYGIKVALALKKCSRWKRTKRLQTVRGGEDGKISK